MVKISVYQSREYCDALEEAGEKVIDIDRTFFAIKKIILTPFGKRKIIEARGTPTRTSAKRFKEVAKDYFYGTIAGCVLDTKEDMFEKIGFKKVENNTVLIDLRPNKSDLRKNLEKKSARWGVKTAEKNRLAFEVAESSRDFKEFYKIYEKTAKKGGFEPESKEFILSLIKTEIAKLFYVKYNGKIIAGGMILIDNEYEYGILDLTSSNEVGLKMQAMPFLYWNIMIYCKDNGMKCFDLGGYDCESKRGDKMYNINKFKERFGGEVKEQPIYSTNWKYPFFRGLMKKFRFLKKMYKK